MASPPIVSWRVQELRVVCLETSLFFGGAADLQDEMNQAIERYTISYYNPNKVSIHGPAAAVRSNLVLDLGGHTLPQSQQDKF